MQLLIQVIKQILCIIKCYAITTLHKHTIKLQFKLNKKINRHFLTRWLIFKKNDHIKILPYQL